MNTRMIKSMYQARYTEWVCTKCDWQGCYSSTTPVMYHGIDWQHCPICNAIVIPVTGSTEKVSGEIQLESDGTQK